MPKQKSHKGLSKRIKVTARGKLLHRRAGRAHLLGKKSSRRRRRLGKDAQLADGQAKIVRRLMGR